MKKLMIAAAIVCAAAFAQAASVSWTITGIGDAPGSKSGGVASENYAGYIFLIADSSATPDTPALNQLTTLDAILAAFEGGNYPEDSLPTAYGSVDITGSASLLLEDLDVTGASATKPITLTAMAVIFDSWNSDPTDDSAPVWSSYQVLTKDFEFIEDGMLASSSTASNDWVAAPEPTTGLLMLLGMGALALRRRRA